MSRQIDAPSGPSTSGGSLASLQVRCTANPYVSRDPNQFLTALERRTTWDLPALPSKRDDEVANPPEETSPCSKRSGGCNPSTITLATPGAPDFSAVKPGVCNYLPEGFRGGGR